MGHKVGIIFIVAVCLLWSAVEPAVAEEARLTRMTVSNTRDDLLLYLTMEGAFTGKLKEAIYSGVPATFVFYISLFRVRNWWADKKIADIKLTHTIKYNNLKKEFTVKRSWKEADPVVTHSFLQAQQWMAEVEALSVYPLRELEKGRQYQIRTKAEVSKLTLPLYLHYILFSLWDVETDWYTIDFIY
ncbi:MAG: DUF4390 domain-containing protein [Desulfobacterales bacterium]|jgi:hypothetical protein